MLTLEYFSILKHIFINLKVKYISLSLFFVLGIDQSIKYVNKIILRNLNFKYIPYRYKYNIKS